jgi:uncharacterized membrane protein
VSLFDKPIPFRDVLRGGDQHGEDRSERRLVSSAARWWRQVRPEEREDPGWYHPLVHRVSAGFAVLSLFLVAFQAWTTIVQVPITGAISVVCLASAVGLLIAVLVVDARHLPRVDLAVLMLGLLAMLGLAISAIYGQPSYNTDEAAFVQYAATLLLHGHNPYGANLAPALNEFRVPVQYATYLLGGGVVHNFGYPSVSLLVAAVFIPLTGGVQSVVISDVVALAATCVVAYVLLPRPWKSLAIVITIGLPTLFDFSVSGVTSILMGLPLVVVACRWPETGRGGRLARSDVVAAICLGLAAATQQLPWFITPFLLVGIWRLRRSDIGTRQARRVVATFAGVGLATFLAVNMPFIIWDPTAWLSGVTAPLTQHAIPYGQGLIDATLFFGAGGGALVDYTLAGVLIYVGLLFCYAAWFNKLGRACFVLPVVALFFTTRSLAEYFLTLIAVWAISLLTTRARDFAAVPTLWARRFGRSKAALAFCPALVAAVLAVGTPSPMHLSVLSVTTNGELEGVWKVKVAVTNTSGRTLSPQFEANYVGQATTFFHRIGGPAELAPGAHAVYTIVAPNRGSMPGIVTPFVIVATTASPETLSVSPQFIAQPFSADLEPGYVDQILPRKGAVTFNVYLRSPFGAFVHKEGVRIALGEIIYGQESLILAEGSINGRPEGMTPVTAVTNNQGVATFVVTDPQPQGQPLYFQAWVAGSFPNGYSQIVPVIWQS